MPLQFLRSRRWPRIAGALVLAGAASLPLLGSAGAAGALVLSPTGSLTISWRGNGHGHGMSQYGAQGAALEGRTYQQILAFYYPGTTLTKLAPSKIRVLLSGTGDTVQVRAQNPMTVTNYGPVHAEGVRWFRLLASKAVPGLSLQAYTTSWKTLVTGLPDGSAFTRGPGKSVRLRDSDGTEARYFGQLRAVLRDDDSGVDTVDLVNLDTYARGVVPYEMPASWQPAAVAAQAVAARTYGCYAVEHPRGDAYDICDTSSCQVYGGEERYDSHGQLTGTDDPAAIAGNAGLVLRYHGATIVAQFSASNGGWTADGGEPYLVAEQDPYDAAGGTNPYTAQHKTMTVASLAASFGLTKATGLAVTKRDGNGTWGGRVESGVISGIDAKGKPDQVTFDGSDLQSAAGVGTDWINITIKP